MDFSIAKLLDFTLKIGIIRRNEPGGWMTVTLYKWTLDRYHQAIDAGVFEQQSVELLQGNIVVMAPEREPHACYSSDGAEYLRQRLGNRASIRETKPITFVINVRRLIK